MNEFILEEHQAWLFFKSLITGKTKYLECKDHETVFQSLYDAYFEARNDTESVSKLNAQVRIAELSQKIAFFKYAYTIINKLPLSIDLIFKTEKALESAGLKVDLKDPQKALTQIRQKIGLTENEIEIQKLNLIENSEDKKTDKKFNFTKVLVGFEIILGFTINSDISLGKFLHYEKACISKHKEYEQQKNKRR